MFFTIWNISRIYFFFFSIQNIKRNSYNIFLKFFPIIFFWWNIYYFPVNLPIKVSTFVILCGSFFISSWFNTTVTTFWKHLFTFLLIGFIVVFLSVYLFVWFLSNQENLYMIHDDSGLFYGIYNTINEHNQIWNH